MGVLEEKSLRISFGEKRRNTMSDATGTVTLRNGDTVTKVLVGPIMAALEALLYKVEVPKATAVIDLIQHCRYNVPIVGSAQEVLRSFGLLEKNGKLNEVVKSVVLSAVVGDEYTLRLDSPYNIE
jgi:hypothetical protein